MNISRILLFLLSLVTVFFVNAQTFNFEGGSVPTEWNVIQGGTLSISSEHYKEGAQSLCWEVNGNSILTVTFPSFTASTGNSAFLHIYSPSISNDTLIVEFLAGANVRRTANYLLNYKGWREFNRAYIEYVSNVSFTASSVRMTYKPSSNSSRQIFLDDVKFNQSTQANRIMGTQWLLDKSFLSASTEQLNLYANVTDIAVVTPSAEELSDLSSLRSQLARTPTAGTFQTLIQAKNFSKNFSITRNADGSVKGNVADLSAATLTTAVMTDYVTKLEILAAEGLKDETTLQTFRNLLDHLMDQGLAEGVSFIIKTNDYTPARTIPSQFLNLLPACTDEQKVELLKLVRWLSYYDKIYDSEATYLQSLNSDVVYLFLPHMMAIALFQTDDAVAVRELKAFKRFLERNTEYVPGGGDILKPDGTGFHHNTQYNNYMYSYQTWTEYINYLKGTVFRIGLPAYNRLKKAVISKYIMATTDTNNARHYANTLAGRNPFSSGVQVFYSRALFENLIDIGGDIMGTSIDEDLAGAYNYFFKSNKYNVTEKNYDGFHQFNYGSLGIFRKNNWVVTMHAPTTKFWGAEIYSGANRFGRYQSHGALEVTYNGTVANSGYPGNKTGGGWDWNVVPGTTTVHYTSWQDMMPNKTTSDRFDQYTKTKNFSGALAWGNYGIFATDFDQIDTWGSQKFVPTNLVFKKSMFAFNNLIISMGTNISSSGSYDASMLTATNLFQNLVSSVSTAPVLNGTEVTNPNTVILSSMQDNWMVNAQGTGYFIPKGNDEVKLIYGSQKSPVESGSDYANPTTTVNAVKSYINHGVKPTNKSYVFAVVPGTNSSEMQDIASQMANDGGSVYKIQMQNEYLHAITYKPENINAYSFFGARFNLNFGIVKSSTGEHLLMHKADEISGRQYFAATNPNLKPVSDANFGWKSSTTQATLTIAGEWLPLNQPDGVQIHPFSNGETQITLTFKDGEPLYFSLRRKDDTGIDVTTDNQLIKYYNNNDFLNIILDESIYADTVISIFSSTGQVVYQNRHNSQNNLVTIPVHGLSKGVYLCKISIKDKGDRTFKWIKSE
ncbi:chondroitinase family polysaccharide lyase [Paludibacter sp.]